MAEDSDNNLNKSGRPADDVVKQTPETTARDTIDHLLQGRIGIKTSEAVKNAAERAIQNHRVGKISRGG